MSAQKVDVLAWFDDYIRRCGAYDDGTPIRAAVAELIKAAKLVNADHAAPHDCYATGPLTGDPYLDLVRCPGCQLATALANIGGDA